MRQALVLGLSLSILGLASCAREEPRSEPSRPSHEQSDDLILKDVPQCVASELSASLTQACSPSSLGDIDFVNAAPFASPELPRVHVGHLYGVRMTSVGGANEGAVELTPARAGTYMIYLGTPNMPIDIAGATPACGLYLTDTIIQDLTGGDCENRRFLGAYKVELQAQTYALRLGPISPQSWVRVYIAPVEGSVRATKVAAGFAHTCAVLEGNHLKCWGSNDSGELGQGNAASKGYSLTHMGDNLPPIRFGTDVFATSVTAGVDRSCAVMTDGRVKCWGYNGVGELGLEDTLTRGDTVATTGAGLPFVNLGSGLLAQSLHAGEHHTCAVLQDGLIKCWGLNAYGQLGLPHRNQRGSIARTMGNRLTPLAMGAGRTVVDADASSHHSCAVLDDGSLRCWGCGPFGQLGQGYLDSCPPGSLGVENVAPVMLGTGRTAVAVATGGEHTCAVLDDGSVKCWGFNAHGQLGYGDRTLRGDDLSDMGDGLPVVDLGAGRHALHIDAGEHHTCALLDDHSVKCWGYNTHGQLGLGDGRPRGVQPGEMGDALPPVDLGTGRTVSDLSVGFHHTCAVLDDGSLKCWGSNARGQLGLGESPRMRRGDQPNEMGSKLRAVYLGVKL